VILAFLAGYSYVKYLSVHPTKMDRFLAITLFLVGGIVVFMAAYLSRQQVYIAAIFSLALFVLGYTLATWRLMNMPDDRPMPRLTRSPDDAGGGHTAVIYFTHGEPTTYTPIAWVNQFKPL
jgi:hypothetical protein